MKFKVEYSRSHRRGIQSTAVLDTLGQAIHEARRVLPTSKTVVILRDSEGEDHPDNAGKFFLYQIIK